MTLQADLTLCAGMCVSYSETNVPDTVEEVLGMPRPKGALRGFVQLSLERDELIPYLDGLKAGGEKGKILRRSIRVLGVSIPVFVLASVEG